MKRIRIFTEEEMKSLLKNPNILGIKNNSQIIYKSEFKLWAVNQKLKFKEKTAREIFEQAGFDMNILNERTPRERLSNWIKNYQKFGKEYFISNNKYRYKSSSNFLTKAYFRDDDMLKELKKYNELSFRLIILIERLLERL